MPDLDSFLAIPDAPAAAPAPAAPAPPSPRGLDDYLRGSDPTAPTGEQLDEQHAEGQRQQQAHVQRVQEGMRWLNEQAGRGESWHNRRDMSGRIIPGIAGEAARRIPGVPLPQLEQTYGLESARRRVAENPPLDLALPDFPVAGAIVRMSEASDLRYSHARAERGEATPEDYRRIAEAEHLARARGDRTLAEWALHGIKGLPALTAELAAAGPVLEGVGGLAAMGARAGASRLGLSAGASALAADVGGFAARAAATPAVVPSFGFPEGLAEGRGRQAYAIGTINAAVLGSIGRLVPRVLPGGTVGVSLARIPAGIGVGMVEQQAADAVSGMIDEHAGYGILGHIAQGNHGEALKHAVTQAVTFGIFTGQHELPVLMARASQAMSRQGLSANAAGTRLNEVTEQVQRNPEAAQNMRGPVGDYARTLAEGVVNANATTPPAESPQPQAPQSPAQRPPQDILHQPPQGPEPGLERGTPEQRRLSPEQAQGVFGDVLSEEGVQPPTERPAAPAARPEPPETAPGQGDWFGRPAEAEPTSAVERMRQRAAERDQLVGELEGQVRRLGLNPQRIRDEVREQGLESAQEYDEWARAEGRHRDQPEVRQFARLVADQQGEEARNEPEWTPDRQVQAEILAHRILTGERSRRRGENPLIKLSPQFKAALDRASQMTGPELLARLRSVETERDQHQQTIQQEIENARQEGHSEDDIAAAVRSGRERASRTSAAWEAEGTGRGPSDAGERGAVEPASVRREPVTGVPEATAAAQAATPAAEAEAQPARESAPATAVRGEAAGNELNPVDTFERSLRGHREAVGSERFSFDRLGEDMKAAREQLSAKQVGELAARLVIRNRGSKDKNLAAIERYAAEPQATFERNQFRQGPQAESMLAAAQRRGGISYESVKNMLGPEEAKRVAKQMPGLFKGGARPLDALAEEMQRTGELRVPEHLNPADALMQAILQRRPHGAQDFEASLAGSQEQYLHTQAEQAEQQARETPGEALEPPGATAGPETEVAPGVFFHRGAGGKAPAGPTAPPGSQAASLPTPISGAAAGTVGEGILRHRNAELARRRERVANDLAAGKDFYDVHTLAAPDPATRTARFLEFTDAYESGNVLALGKEPLKAADAVRTMYDEREPLLASRELVKSFQENYFGRILKDPRNPNTTPQEMFQRIMSKKTLTGPEGFRKARRADLITFRDVIDAGLEPATWNPVEMAMMKANEIDRSIFGHDAWEETKTQGINRFVRLGQRPPQGWKQAPDRLAQVLAPGEAKMKEFFDQQQSDKLDAWMKANGIAHERTQRGPAGSESQAGVTTRFATPEQVKIHEIGHALDRKYNLQPWAQNPSLKPELDALADLRAPGNTNPDYHQYLHSPPELIANMFTAYLHTPDLMRQVAPNAHQVLESFLGSHAETRPLQDITPSLQLGERDATMRLAGPMLTGHYYMPQEVANLFETHLSQGLQGNTAYRAFRGLGNQLNMFQLGWSAFHATGTALNAQFSAIASTLRSASLGDFTGAAKKLPAAIVPGWAQVEYLREGRGLRQEYFKPGSGTPEMQEMTRFLEEAGGRARMDSFYGAGHWQQWMTAISQTIKTSGRMGKTSFLLQALPALNELVSKPVLSHQVPLTKMGVFADMARTELQRLGPDATLNQRREVLGRAWDSVENRFGELTYDNLFWNRAFKDIMLAGVRSVGWNLGTWRELGGAVKDLPASARGVVRGEGISNRTAYLAGLTMGTAFLGGMTGYLLGNPPEELKDYFFPRTGRRRRDGSEDRLSLPTYMRDLYAISNRADEGPVRIAQNAFTMAKGKFNPAPLLLGEMLSNQDFYGTAIRNPNDSAVRQSWDTMLHALKAAEPLAVRSFRQQHKEGAGVGRSLLGFAGITPAPAYVTRTSEQQRAIESGRRYELTPLEKRRRGLR